MPAKIHSCTYSIQQPPVDASSNDVLIKWLADQAQKSRLEWLLAHSDEGVIWGRMVNGDLRLSSKPFPRISPELDIKTLQQVRLFGSKAELLAWRSSGGWQARLLAEDGDRAGWYYDESQWLWGDHVEAADGDFTVVADGEQGLRHAVPLIGIPFDPPNVRRERWHPLRLDVRQYLERQPDGRLTMIQGRLIALRFEPKKEESK